MGLNILESKEASTTLCGTLAGAEVHSGMSYPVDELICNRGYNGELTEEKISSAGNIAYCAAYRACHSASFASDIKALQAFFNG